MEDNYVITDGEEKTSLTEMFEHYRTWYKWNVQDNGAIKFRKNEMGKRIRSVFKVESLGQEYVFNPETHRSERETMYPIKLIEAPADVDAIMTEEQAKQLGIDFK